VGSRWFALTAASTAFSLVSFCCR